MNITNAHKLAASRLFLTEGDVDDLIALAMIAAHDEAGLRVVDLGAGSGTTALAILQTRLDAHVWTVDIALANLHWAEANLKGFGEEIGGYETLAITGEITEKPEPRWTPIEADAAAFAKTWGDEERPLVDILLHDASHEEADVRRDILAWLPNLRPDAMIWVHDYLPMPGAGAASPGVMAAIDDLVVEGWLNPLVGERSGIGWIGFAGPRSVSANVG